MFIHETVLRLGVNDKKKNLWVWGWEPLLYILKLDVCINF